MNGVNHGAVVKAAWRGHREVLEWLLLADDGPHLLWQLKLPSLSKKYSGLVVAEIAFHHGTKLGQPHVIECAEWLRTLVAADESVDGP